MKFDTKEQRERFILDNIRLVDYTLKRKLHYEPIEHSYEDMFNVGVIGLVKSADAFDPKYNIKFSTFAIYNIMREIEHYSRHTREGIHYAQQLLINKRKAERLIKTMSIEDVAKELNKDVKEIEELININFKVSSLNSKVDNNECDKKSEFQDSFGYEVDFDTNLYLESLFSALSKREKEIIFERFIKEEKQYDIGLNHGLSQAQISRIIKGGLNKMKKVG